MRHEPLVMIGPTIKPFLPNKPRGIPRVNEMVRHGAIYQ